ncbi:hypothetical protein BH11ACT8_BH11ACT8_11250 [soil metagenome]
MSEHDDGGPIFGAPPEPAPEAPAAPRRRRRKSALPGYLAMLIALAVVAVVGYVGVTRGIDTVKDRFGGPDDFAAGAATGSVTFEVSAGESVTTVGQNLESAGVVASVQAFSDAVDASGRSIQVGVFPLQKKMAAGDVVAVLVDAGNRLSSLTLLPGKTTDEIIALLAKDTDYSKADYDKVLTSKSLDLPQGARGSAEGYLFPDQYLIAPDATAQDILQMMVDRFVDTATEVDLAGAAERLGYTQHQLVTIASLLQAEVPTKLMPKVARVIYNRLEIDPNPTAGFLQIDASVNYALGRGPITRLTLADIDSVADSPYNTYRQKGLPPGPIEAPGASALEAAGNPVKGPWFFYVTTNLKTQKTKFTADYQEFLRYSDELDLYCATESASGCG